MFCQCKVCDIARNFAQLHERSKTPGVVERHKALTWKPEPLKDEADPNATP